MRAYVTARGACDVTARVIHCFDLLSPSHARGVARSLARSHARHARVMSHRSRARDVTSRVVVSISLLRCLLRAPRVTRVYAYVITAHRARHHRFPPPPRTTGTRALLRRRRSLARSRARRRRRWGWGWRSVIPRVMRVTLAHVHVTTAHRARHHRSSPPRAPTRARCDGGGARSLDSARGVWRLRWRWRAVEVAGGYIARHARYARRSPRAYTRTSSLCIARVITVFRLPAHDRHAHIGGRR